MCWPAAAGIPPTLPLSLIWSPVDRLLSKIRLRLNSIVRAGDIFFAAPKHMLASLL